MTAVDEVNQRPRVGIALRSPSSALPRRSDLRIVAVSLLLLDFGALGLASGQRAPVDAYGLINALPLAYLVAISGIVGLFLFSLLRTQTASWTLYAIIVVLVVVLALGPALLEPFPRFSTSWTHAGFTDYIGRHGQVLQDYDARFSWPGFFVASAALAASAGVSPLSLLRWAPMALDLLYLVPLLVIVHSFTADARRRALAVFIFVISNWMGQDYFAPQGLNFFLFLVFAALFLRGFTSEDRNTRIARALDRVLARHEPARTTAQRAPLTPLARINLICLLLLVYTASVVSHQLTQFFMLFFVTALVLLGATRLRSLPVVLVVISVAYFVWGAAGYWTGHLHELVSGIGDVRTSLQQNVSARTVGSADPARAVVVRARMGMTGAVWLLALLGLGRVRAKTMMVPAVLAIVPFLVLSLQSYNGEALLRVHLFALPFVAVLAAQVLPVAGERSERAGRSGRRGVLIRIASAAVLSVALPATFLLSRYGNESFEQMTAPDVGAVRQLYAVAPPGSTLYSLNDDVPWKYRDLGSYGYASLATPPWRSQDPSVVLAGMLRSPQPPYLLLTEAQWKLAREMVGVDPARIEEAQRMIETTPLLKRIYGRGPVGIYVLSDRAPE